uniref:Uncharacterized protein n=1 Tax=Sinocyclocheilus anshuiensis TaxID=1608454 RepID=A0A671M9Q0_9TELE
MLTDYSPLITEICAINLLVLFIYLFFHTSKRNILKAIHRMPSQQPKSSNQWSTEVFDCLKLIASIGCISIFCFPCVACTTAKRYGECFCLPLIDEFGLMRVSMRHRYGIEGSLVNDCLLSYFCCPCIWCQMSREMDNRKNCVIMVNSQTN